MSYPSNKRERLQIGRRKSFKRVAAWFYGYSNPDEEHRKKCARGHRDTTKKCSSLLCCGNPRRRGELTFQEIRFLDSLKD